MKPSGKYILDGHEPVPCENLITWGRFMENIEQRRVASDEKGDVHVSTVFLGMDHGWNGDRPVLFETMVFGGPLDEHQARYHTWEEAEKGHAEMCSRAFTTTPE